MKTLTLELLPSVDTIVWLLTACVSIPLSDGGSVELSPNQEYDKNIFNGSSWLIDTVSRGYWGYDETKQPKLRKLGETPVKDSLKTL